MTGLCGVTRFDGTKVRLERLRRAALAGAGVGSDQVSYWTIGRTLLAAIGAQPTVSDDRRLCLVADLELQGRRELAGELEEAGTLRARKPDDRQLVVASYERWVEDCPGHLSGAFALVLWDGRAERLFCARDADGARPLFFAQLGPRLWVASKISQLLALPECPSAADSAWLAGYLAGRAPQAGRTPFVHIQVLPRGQMMLADAAGLTVRPYIHPGPPGGAADAPGAAGAGGELPAWLQKDFVERTNLQQLSPAPVDAALFGWPEGPGPAPIDTPNPPAPADLQRLIELGVIHPGRLRRRLGSWSRLAPASRQALLRAAAADRWLARHDLATTAGQS